MNQEAIVDLLRRWLSYQGCGPLIPPGSGPRLHPLIVSRFCWRLFRQRHQSILIFLYPIKCWTSWNIKCLLLFHSSNPSGSLAPSDSSCCSPCPKEIPKASGHDQCPMCYVNILGITCVSPIYYKVAPTNGEGCKSGRVNISAWYCKKKKGSLGILWF